jgi:hypothetical protein
MSLHKYYLIFTVFLMLSGCSPSSIIQKPQTTSYPDCSQQPDSLALLPKRVAVINFSSPTNLGEKQFPNLSQFYSHGFVDSLQKSNRFIIENMTHIDLTQNQTPTLGRLSATTSEQIKEISRLSKSQLVIRGHITELSHASNNSGLQNLVSPPSQTIGIDLEIFDGYSGSLYQRIPSGRQIFGPTTDALSRNHPEALFQDKQLNLALNSLWKEQVDISYQVSSCLPLGGRVIHVSDDKVSIDLGKTSRIEVGDQFLVIFSRYLGVNTAGLEEVRRSHGRIVTIESVQPESAHGSLEATESIYIDRIKIGDIVIGL